MNFNVLLYKRCWTVLQPDRCLNYMIGNVIHWSSGECWFTELWRASKCWHIFIYIWNIFFLNHNNQWPIFIQNISTNEEVVTLTAADMLQNCSFALEDRFYNKHCFIFLKCQALFSHSPKESCTPNTYVKNHCLSLSCVFKLKCCQMLFFRLCWVQLVLSICGAIYWNMATHHWPHPQRKITNPP